MSIGEFLFRLLFPRYHAEYQQGLVWRYATIDRLNDARFTRADVLAWLADTDWVVVERGGEMVGDRVRENEGQCPCERNWDLTGGSVTLKAKPTQKDITALYATIAEPELGACSGNCMPVTTFTGKYYVVMKNLKTGDFWVHGSKRIAWHCEVKPERGLSPEHSRPPE